ncbi:uncharacterized protein LOC141531508 [Cotesia typhae]
MFAKALIIASLAFCGVVSYEPSPYKACKNAPEPINLFIDNCEYFPCPIYTGYNINAQWEFLASNEITKLTPVARYNLMGLFWMDYPDLKITGCDNLVGEVTCPLKPNQVGTFQLSFPVPNVPMKSFSIPIWVEFSLQDQYKNVHSCFQVSLLVKKWQ